MTSLQALAIAVLISLALSTVLSLAIFGPLRMLLQRACPGGEAVVFWERFMLIMLFLSPLFVSIVWGLPPPSAMPSEEAGSVVQHLISTGLVGAFLAMLGMGFWVSALVRRMSLPGATPRPRDKEIWGERKDP